MASGPDVWRPESPHDDNTVRQRVLETSLNTHSARIDLRFFQSQKSVARTTLFGKIFFGMQAREQPRVCQIELRHSIDWVNWFFFTGFLMHVNKMWVATWTSGNTRRRTAQNSVQATTQLYSHF